MLRVKTTISKQAISSDM
uniref:Uncharacterized protein n=1 Tax=Arundo donax TaxID=35708 RepID=A0A0A9FPB9_ARUDO